MNQNYITPNEWSIIEEGFEKDRVESSESLFSIGNGAMGQRANFEEDYSGDTFQGTYIAGVYYPDKTRVGWWKNGYPEYFAKVLNAPNIIGIKVSINDETLDLNTCKVSDFKRELNMKEGWLSRSFTAELNNGIAVEVKSKRFLHLDQDELAAIRYSIKPLNKSVKITYEPYLDSGIINEDSNWDDQFWNTTDVSAQEDKAFIEAHTMKTNFHICAFMQSRFAVDGRPVSLDFTKNKNKTYVGLEYQRDINRDEEFTIYKYTGFTVDRYYEQSELKNVAEKVLDRATEQGFDQLLATQKNAWAKIWDMADITIDGDVRAQQGIRFNIFQLNQTYLGKDSRLNIGPKGFTGEKYGGSTYWDTEAYCLPFYMATKDAAVARNLLEYRYNHLEKAIENAEKLGFTDGAALYPMVTMNGEECHNEWEITFEEIHRNGAIAFAIFNYTRFTEDQGYIPEKGLEVLIAIARFWFQRANFSQQKNKYVILGVTGPNEYENNINNNFYTNFIAQWCIEYTIRTMAETAVEYADDYARIIEKTGFREAEIEQWKAVAENMYFPFSEQHNVYLQQDGFLDKELKTVAELDKKVRPINQYWSWDRILRSPYIKQADVLQGFYFFENHFTIDELERHFDFYEPFTVHESSLSPCVHSIQAAKLDRMDQAYEFYLRTARLDLDDYNKEVHEGLHITSMAGTWMSIVEGFGGMRVDGEGYLCFDPKIPKQWEAYSFKVNFRNNIIKVTVDQKKATFSMEGEKPITIAVNMRLKTLSPDEVLVV